MKLKFIFLLSIILFTSCSKQRLITQGESGAAKINENNYEIKTLDQVTESSQSFFGFSAGEINRDGYINNTLAVSPASQSNFLRLLTFLGYGATYTIVLSPPGTVAGLALLGGLFLGGISNNATWSWTSENAAIRKANLMLIEDNPEVDLFIYPKYNIETRGGIFGNRSKATINAKGAILK